MLKHILFLMLMSLTACNTSDQLPDGIFFHENYFGFLLVKENGTHKELHVSGSIPNERGDSISCMLCKDGRTKINYHTVDNNTIKVIPEDTIDGFYRYPNFIRIDTVKYKSDSIFVYRYPTFEKIILNDYDKEQTFWLTQDEEFRIISYIAHNTKKFEPFSGKWDSYRSYLIIKTKVEQDTFVFMSAPPMHISRLSLAYGNIE